MSNETKLTALCKQRDDLDYEAFRILSEMEGEGLLARDALMASLLRDEDMSRADARETADYYVDAVRDILTRRRALDQAIIAAGVSS